MHLATTLLPHRTDSDLADAQPSPLTCGDHRYCFTPRPLHRTDSDLADAQPSPLTCGEPVEYTVYDFLKGIARRDEHKPFPEPEVAMIFKKSETDSTVDLFDVEMGLRKAYQEVCRWGGREG